ncbi:MAG: SLC13 family permease [Anaerolineae bacterium]
MAVVLVVLVTAMAFFVTGRLRADVVALLVLATLAVTGLVTPEQAVAGFSNPAVITLWAVLILSGALYKTGVARVIGQRVLALAGTGEARLITVIMISAALTSAVMNNVGVVALLLPVVMDLSRRTRIAPSRLLMPLAFGTLMGGLLTMIGTPPNLLVSGVLHAAGMKPFELLDFLPMGVAVTVAGVAAMVLVGRRLLPERAGALGDGTGEESLDDLYHIDELQFVLRLRRKSALAEHTLAESRLGSALGLTVVAIVRDGETILAPTAETVLEGGDRLVVSGRADRLEHLRESRQLKLVDHGLSVAGLADRGAALAEATVAPVSGLTGACCRDVGFRQRYGVQILAVKRGDRVRLTAYEDLPLEAGDVLLVLGPTEAVSTLSDSGDFDTVTPVTDAAVDDEYRFPERLFALQVVQGSTLAGHTLAEDRLGDMFGLGVVGIMRGDVLVIPRPTTSIEEGDVLIVKARPHTLRTLRALRGLVIEDRVAVAAPELESAEVGLSGVVLSPYTHLVGKTLRDIHFREKYGLSVVAIWRGGKVYRQALRDMELRFGDALLLHGPRHKLRVLASEPDFLVLSQEVQEPLRVDKAATAAAIMGLCVLLPVLLGWLPIHIAALTGAALTVVTGCLTIDEAYRFIEWRAVFLIAGMLPLAIALQTTGAAAVITDRVVAIVGGYGDLAVVAGMFVLATLVAQAMPNSAVAVLLGPIAVETALNLGMSPHALAMTVAVATAASFLSPVAQPASVLVMGPGGYKYSDYVRVGLPLTIATFIVTMVVLPLVWPLR